MRSSARWTTQRFALLYLLVVTPAVGFAQTGDLSCFGDDVSLSTWIAELAPMAPRDAANRLVDDQPLGSPSATQVAASSGGTDSTSLVSGAALPSLLAFAAEKGLASTSDGKITVNLSPFDFMAAFRPEVVDRQTLYEEHALARRFGLAATLGGEGDAFDRDGDGQADEAIESKDLGDIVTWEARFLLAGTRDRRDKKYYRPFLTTLDNLFTAQSDAHAAAAAAVAHYAKSHEDEKTVTVPKNCLSRIVLDKSKSDPDVRAALIAYEEASRALATRAVSAASETAARADAAALWTLFVGGSERREDFGPDRRVAGLRGSWGGKNRNFTLNLEWNETESSFGEKPTTWKAGLEYAVLLFKGGTYKDGIQVAGSGVYEKYENVPSAKHDTVARLGAKLELPVGVGVKIPISVTWANNPELIEGESEIRGHIGFTLDLSQIKKPTSQ